MKVLEKELKEKKVEFVPTCPSDMANSDDKKTIAKHQFGWLWTEELDSIIQSVTGISNAVSYDLLYVIEQKSTTTSYLIDENFNIIKNNYSEKGFPIKFYDGATKELLGFVYLPASELEGLYIFEDSCDLDDMYDALVECQEDDIKFQLMIKNL